jgi:formylmethanofuran dehydrogenase subunit E
MTEPNELKSIIEFARKLHGHLGPYLVIGLKMGASAKKALNISNTESTHLRAEIAVPLYPPFSCLLDGIQVSTTCTIGNQRLSIKNSKSIEATFTKENSSTIIKMKLTKGFSKELEQMHLQNQLDEAQAWKIAGLPENKLFTINIE